jgi:hypothetical protein
MKKGVKSAMPAGIVNARLVSKKYNITLYRQVLCKPTTVPLLLKSENCTKAYQKVPEQEI